METAVLCTMQITVLCTMQITVLCTMQVLRCTASVQYACCDAHYGVGYVPRCVVCCYVRAAVSLASMCLMGP